MDIRKMLIVDLDKVTELFQASNVLAKKKEIYQWTKRGLQKYPDLNLVCLNNKKIIGAISATELNSKEVMINDIAIYHQHRQNGYGTKLMKKMLSVLKRLGFKKVKLWVHWANARAIPFYYKFGFKIVDCGKTHKVKGFPDGQDIIYLEKNI